MRETSLTPFSSINPEGAILHALFSTQRRGTCLLGLPPWAVQGFRASCTLQPEKHSHVGVLVHGKTRKYSLSERDQTAVTDPTLAPIIDTPVSNWGGGLFRVSVGASHTSD